MPANMHPPSRELSAMLPHFSHWGPFHLLPGPPKESRMRSLVIVLATLGGLAAMSSTNPAHAWYDRWGHWHPNHRYYAQPHFYGYGPHAYYRYGYRAPAYYGHPYRPYAYYGGRGYGPRVY